MIIGLSVDIKTAIELKVPDRKVEVITNMADIEMFGNVKRDEALTSELGLEGKFVIAYTGTVGLANHLEYLIAVARACIAHPEIVFLVMGAGAQLDRIKQQAEGLENITFIEPGNKEKVKRVLSVSDAIYISFRKVPVLASGCPNKLFDGLAVGRLIIINFQGWVKTLIEDHNCGFYYDPDRPEDFPEKLKAWLSDSKYLEKCQKRSRTLAREQFSVEKQMEKLSRIFEQFSGQAV